MVGTMAWYIFREELGKKYLLPLALIAIVLIVGFIKSMSLTTLIENKLYQNNIIYSKQTPYQKLIVTAHNGRIQFYINGAIQFDTIDEHRYHESLIHPVMNMAKAHENVLIIGGGDGLALREVLKYKNVGAVTLVDLGSCHYYTV